MSETFQQFAEDVSAYSVAAVLPTVFNLTAVMIFPQVFSSAALGRCLIAIALVSVGSTFLFKWGDRLIIRFAPEIDEDALVGTILAVLGRDQPGNPRS